MEQGFGVCEVASGMHCTNYRAMQRIRAEKWELLCAVSGRNERIFVAGHSAGGQVSEDYALKKTGGLILLVSSFVTCS